MISFFLISLLLLFINNNSGFAKEPNLNTTLNQTTSFTKFTKTEQELWNSLLHTYKLIQKSSIFTNKLSSTNLILSAIEGMVNSLEDPYSVLLKGKSLNQFIENIDNHYSGIGIYIVTNEKGIKIVDVIQDSPAWLIGLNANDIIVEVEGKSVVGVNLEQTKVLLLGKEGTLVKVTILRGNERLNFTVVRKNIQVKSVYWQIFNADKRYGYIRVISFGPKTVKEFLTALNSLKRERVTGLVVDLRNNPGGLLSAVARMIDFFIPKGVVVTTRRVENIQEEINVQPTVLFPSFIPIAILINKYSASASEIFAGAMRDHKRAVLVGEKSFGKFSVQQLFPILTDAQKKKSAVLKLTIAKYFLPSGKSYEQEGIAPHVWVTNQQQKKHQAVSPAQITLDDPYLHDAQVILANPVQYQEYLNKH